MSWMAFLEEAEIELEPVTPEQAHRPLEGLGGNLARAITRPG